MSRQYSFRALVELDLCCDIALLVLLRLCRNNLKLCHDISALANFSAFLARIVFFSFKT